MSVVLLQTKLTRTMSQYQATALLLATVKGHTVVVRELLLAHANVFAKDKVSEGLSNSDYVDAVC